MTEFASNPWQDPSRDVAVRVRDLISKLTLPEKIAQLMNETPAIERLGIPAYDWLNECLHGVARAGTATVFPQAIGMAATWDAERIGRVGRAIGLEARAKHHAFVAAGDRGAYKGLSFFSPNINIFRDPRWGRGQETYGECPTLTARMAVAYIRGMQGEGTPLVISACAKHFAVHSGPEGQRSTFDSRPSERDLRGTYLPAFEATVKEAKVGMVMGAYNRLNGEPCCSNPRLLNEILRQEWGFTGVLVSDGGALDFLHDSHLVTRTPAESAARALKAGCDLELGRVYRHLAEAIESGLATETDVDRALERVLGLRFRLGLLDPAGSSPLENTPYEVCDSAEHHALSREVAAASMVLLKNNGVLPLAPDLSTLAVLGPNADNRDVLIGNYNGLPSGLTTVISALQPALPNTRIFYGEGCDLTDKPVFFVFGPKDRNLTEAVIAARHAKVAVLCLGISPRVEGECGDPEAGESDWQGDRRSLELPKCQTELLEAVLDTGTPTVVVFFGGSPICCPLARERAAAVLHAWYPGGDGGLALADVLTGRISPAGRLPVTFPMKLNDLPPFGDYSMNGRTYRFSVAEPLYPFGHGLSYTRFEYSGFEASRESAKVRIHNAGAFDADEVVQVYLRPLENPGFAPLLRLVAFQRIAVRSGETREVEFQLSSRDFQAPDDSGREVAIKGPFEISVGGCQPGYEQMAATTMVLKKVI